MDVVALQAALAGAAQMRPRPQLVGLSGHSYAYGQGADSDASGFAERYAKTLGAKRWDKRGVPGAILCWAQVRAQGEGGWAFALNSIRQGAQIGSAHPYVQATVTSGDYGPRSTIEVPGWGINDLAQLGSNNLRPFLESLRATMSVMCAAKIIPATNTSFITVSGTFATSGSAGETAGAQQYAGVLQRSTTAGNTLTYTAPPDVPAGRTHGLLFVVKPGDSYVVTVTRGGTQLAQKTVSGAAITDPSHTGVTYPANVYALRLGMPGDGITISPGDVLVITLTSVTSGGMGLTAITIEADPIDGPIVHIPLPNKPAAYTTWATYPFGSSAGTNPMNDASVTAMKAAILAGPAVEFGNRVVTSDFDSVLNTSTDFASDGAHPNNKGHGKIAEQMVKDLLASRLLTARVCARTSGPFTPFWIPFGLSHIANMVGGIAVAQFSNSWATFDANGFSGGTYQMPLYPGFRRDENGRVHFRGRVVGGATATLMTTLPQGYWPANDRYFPITGQDSGGAIVNGQAKVAANGQITLSFVAASGTLSWLALDSVNYPAEF